MRMAFSFLKDEGAGRRPIVAGNAFRKLVGKALLTEYKLPWKEAARHRQYEQHTPGSVNMVLLLTEDALATAQDLCALTID